MIRPRLSLFTDHKKTSVLVAVAGAATVAVAATAVAVTGGGRSDSSDAGTGQGHGQSSATSAIPPGTTPTTGNGSAGGQGSSSSTPTTTGTAGTTGTTPVVTPSTPDYQAPTGRKNADVDCSVTKCVALTFDDGPGPDTSQLLDVLKQNNVPATFFVLGQQAQRYPDLVRREYAEGNEVGNHTFDHRDLSKLTAAQIQDEIGKSADAIAATGIPRPTLVRPPYGAVNATVRAAAGYPFIMWRVDPEDWKYPNPQRVADEIVRNTKPGRIVLSHDTHKTTVEAIPDVISQLKAEGYTFVTVSTLMKGVDLQNGRSYFNRPPAITGQGTENAGPGSRQQAPDPTSTPDTPGDAPTKED